MLFLSLRALRYQRLHGRRRTAINVGPHSASFYYTSLPVKRHSLIRLIGELFVAQSSDKPLSIARDTSDRPEHYIFISSRIFSSFPRVDLRRHFSVLSFLRNTLCGIYEYRQCNIPQEVLILHPCRVASAQVQGLCSFSSI